MRNTFLLAILFFLIHLSTFGQTIQKEDTLELTLSGRITDAASGKAVAGANVSIKNTLKGTSTLADGNYSLQIFWPKDSFPIQIQISHVSYENLEISIAKNFNRQLNLYLIPSIQNLRAVEVYSGPRRIASPYFSEIIDYEIYDHKIVLLEKLDKIRRNRIRIVDFHGNLLGETTVKGKAISLFRDCRDEVYLIMYDRYLKIHHDAGVYVSRSTQNLENRIKNPCRAITDSFLIYEEYGYAKLMSWLLKRRFTDRYSTLFYFSANRLSIRLIQEDLIALRDKYGNIIQDLMYVEANLNNTEETRIRNLVLEEDLSQQSLFYQPNYCPIFKEKNGFRIFDHGNNLMLQLNPAGKIVAKKRIRYHTKLAWKPQIFQDESSGKYYTIMKRGVWTYLYNINPQTGIATMFYKIENALPEKIKLYDGYLLYLYRKPHTPDRYSLYLEQY